MTIAREIINLGLNPALVAALGGTPANPVAAGTTIANATPITNSLNVVTGADAAKGVALPAVAPGETIEMFNRSASVLLVYPPPSGSIAITGTGLGTVDAVYSQEAETHVTFKCLGVFYDTGLRTQWVAIKSE